MAVVMSLQASAVGRAARGDVEVKGCKEPDAAGERGQQRGCHRRTEDESETRSHQEEEVLKGGMLAEANQQSASVS